MASEAFASCCKRLGCSKPPWNGLPGEFCSRSCRDASSRGSHQPKEIEEPCLDAIRISDPRELSQMLPVVAFYFPGHEEPCDTICRSSFLGNFYDLGHNALVLTPPGSTETHCFRNAEAAFQALKFWHKAEAFEELSGLDAFRRKQDFVGEEDPTFCGFGSNWKAMLAVLQAKFKPGARWTNALLQTGDAFLLEHNSISGRDSIWSDDKYGEGKNWLGLQLMLVRGQCACSTSWTDPLSKVIDLTTGEALNPESRRVWQDVVRRASTRSQEAIAQDRARRQRAEHQFTRWGDLGEPNYAKPIAELCGDGRVAASELVPRATCSPAANRAVALVRGDITELCVDAIVAPRDRGIFNSYPPGAAARAIHAAAGLGLAEALRKEACNKPEQPAIITPGFNLKAKRVVHSVAPLFKKPHELCTCYSAALDCAARAGARVVAFPCISTGPMEIPFPKKEAARIALGTTRQWLDTHRGLLDCAVFVAYAADEHEIYAALLPQFFPRSSDFSLAFEEPDQGEASSTVKVNFVWSRGGDCVKLAGDFNEWDDSDRAQMAKYQDGVFREVVPLQKGRTYEYKFIVDGHWRSSKDQPTVKGGMGFPNNVMDLTGP